MVDFHRPGHIYPIAGMCYALFISDPLERITYNHLIFPQGVDPIGFL